MNIKFIRDLAELIYAYGDAGAYGYLSNKDFYVEIGKSKELFDYFQKNIDDFYKINPWIENDDLEIFYYLNGHIVDCDTWHKAEEEYVLNKIEEYLLEHFKEKE